MWKPADVTPLHKNTKQTFKVHRVLITPKGGSFSTLLSRLTIHINLTFYNYCSTLIYDIGYLREFFIKTSINSVKQSMSVK